jgi:hypothetical protein
MWLCRRDLSKECKGKYRDCTDCVLDRIRAEIEQIADEEQKHDKKWATGLRYAVKIIDKYEERNNKCIDH